MRDDESIIPKAVKEMIGKVASNLIKGKFYDITQTAAPAYLHHYCSQHILTVNDNCSIQSIYDAFDEKDPLKRITHIIKYCLSGNWINATLLGCRAPLNPILGETC